MTVFRSKSFRKTVRRVQRKLWRKRATRKSKQRGGYIPYRRDPPGGVTVVPLDWDDQLEKA